MHDVGREAGGAVSEVADTVKSTGRGATDTPERQNDRPNEGTGRAGTTSAAGEKLHSERPVDEEGERGRMDEEAERTEPDEDNDERRDSAQRVWRPVEDGSESSTGAGRPKPRSREPRPPGRRTSRRRDQS